MLVPGVLSSRGLRALLLLLSYALSRASMNMNRCWHAAKLALLPYAFEVLVRKRSNAEDERCAI